jgi:hypothetical protein
MSWNDKLPFSESYALLEKEAAEGRPWTGEHPVRLPLDDIGQAHSVFQPRLFEGNAADHLPHVAALVDAVRNNADHTLDPLTVWWSGKRWTVIDGHHRHKAYQQARGDDKKPVAIEGVPVEVFEGTLAEAIVEATKRNSKDKLSMTKLDKLERAWKLVALDSDKPMSKAQIAAATRVADGTVANMRKARGELLAIGMKPDGIVDMTWEEVKRGAVKERPKNEEWEEKQAREWARRMGKAFGNKLARQPSIFARAVELYSEGLPGRLVEEWDDYARDMLGVNSAF